MNKTEAIEDPSDDAALEQAAQAREQGTDLIREHLRGHLHQNPTSSYVVQENDLIDDCRILDACSSLVRLFFQIIDLDRYTSSRECHRLD